MKAPRAASTRLSLAVMLVAVAALITAFAVSAASSSSASTKDREISKSQAQVVPGGYIVQLEGDPVIAYDGGTPGFEATKPKKGEKLDPDAEKVKKYAAHLVGRHNAVLSKVGGTKISDYVYAVNGFAAKLSEGQANTLAKLPEVANVEPMLQVAPDTSRTPAFLGLTQPGGLWSQLGGPGGAGEGRVVGVIDTGIWPESPSVDDEGPDGTKVYDNLKKSSFSGKCASAETVTDGSWDANLCNRKLVGAQFFVETSDSFGVKLAPNEFRSPRDSDGHGTHTSTTAAGNFGVEPTGVTAGFGAISGMAPRARIATYKTCWDDGNPATGGCFFGDIVSAFDRAVADGVDAINVSIGGSTTSVVHSVEVAAFNAAAAGVFVAFSAGNSGPGASTVAHASPWAMTVGASTHDRPAVGKVELGNGQTFSGPSQMKGSLGSKSIIRAQDAGLPGVNANLLRQCFSRFEPNSGGNPVLDPAKVAGKVVVCERGGATPNNARVDKSRAVEDAGGVGMILVNTAITGSLNGDVHFVPTVHVASGPNAANPTAHYDAIQAYAQTANPTATLSQDTNAVVNAPTMAAFSSRGPSLATGDQLKPDVTAPGVDILAGYSPASLLGPGRLFDIISGTSMSSPHVAGLGLLLQQKHPTWTPDMIKSALMTTANNTLDTATPPTATQIFAQGAGHVRPTSAADPGLVYKNTPPQWIQFICGTGQLPPSDPNCQAFGSIDPSDLNLASIAIGDMAGTQTVTRTVTNVGSQTELYTSSVTGLAGITAEVTPVAFTIAPGESQTYTVKFTRNTGGPLNAYGAAFLTWSGSNGHVVRSPIVVRPLSIVAPAEVTLDASNSASWEITSGVGPTTITLGKHGLVPATAEAKTVADDPGNSFSPTGPGVVSKQVTVPAGATIRAATFDENTDGNPDDLDLYLFRGSQLVANSLNATSNEVVTHVNTGSAATYTIFVHGFQTDGPDSNFTLFSWLVSGDAGNMTLNGPFSATPGSKHNVQLTTTGLTAGTRYFGRVTYHDGATTLGNTFVSGRAS